MCQGRDTPWLQDTEQAAWWDHWKPTYRDVIVLDAMGARVAVYNLTDNTLTDDANYQALKQLLSDLAGA